MLLGTEERLQQLGESVRQLRLLQNLGQQELTQRAGVGRSAVQNLELGYGTVTTLVRVVRALGREDWRRALGVAPPAAAVATRRREP